MSSAIGNACSIFFFTCIWCLILSVVAYSICTLTVCNSLLWYPYNNDTEVEGEGCVDSKRSDQFKMMCTWRNNNIIIWFIRRFLQIKRLCESLSIHVVGECFIVSTSYCVISYIPSPKCWDIKRQLSRNSSPCDFDYSVSTWHCS